MKSNFVEDPQAKVEGLVIITRIIAEFYERPYREIGGAALENLRTFKYPTIKKGVLMYPTSGYEAEAYLIEDGNPNVSARKEAVVYFCENGTWYAR